MNRRTIPFRAATLAFVALACMTALPGGCSTTYYKTMEFFGREKRDILASRVQDAKADQEAAKVQFQSALDRFAKLVNSEGGELRKAYDRAKSDLEASEAKAAKVHDRVASVESVGNDLFAEWEVETKQYSSEDLRKRSREQLRTTRSKFDEMLGAMKKAESRMDPVLAAFRDSVLYLKHNLNAQTVAGMRGAVLELETQIGVLVQDMERSMAEADKFVKEIK